MKKVFVILLSILVLINIIAILSPNYGFAYDFKDKSGLDETAGETGHTSGAITSEEDFSWMLGKIIRIVVSLVGVIFLLLMIYAGYLWMMAAGNEQQAGKAKTIIKNSIFGLIVLLGAYGITAIMEEVVKGATN